MVVAGRVRKQRQDDEARARERTDAVHRPSSRPVEFRREIQPAGHRQHHDGDRRGDAPPVEREVHAAQTRQDREERRHQGHAHQRGRGRHRHRQREVRVTQRAPQSGKSAGRRRRHQQQRDSRHLGKRSHEEREVPEERHDEVVAAEAGDDASHFLELEHAEVRVAGPRHARDEQEEQDLRRDGHEGHHPEAGGVGWKVLVAAALYFGESWESSPCARGRAARPVASGLR
mmetsp:Transcript_968/g.2934  ORF Transcript_968/g.2934 Transcript_968/m.2934 type:complete len:230 (+) Transcript_968:636-1325(+)